MGAFGILVSTTSDFVLEHGPALQVAVACGLGVVLAWSGVAKLLRPGRAALAMVDLAVLDRPHAAAGFAVGAFESWLAAMLVLGALAIPRILPLAAASAAVLLTFFTLLMANQLRLGSKVPCFCFGDEEPITPQTLARTLILALLALAAVVALPFALPAAFEQRLLAGIGGGAVLSVVILTSASASALRVTGHHHGTTRI